MNYTIIHKGGQWGKDEKIICVGWKEKKKPNLVFGILSDTHLQSAWDGVTPHAAFPLTYVTTAMQLFQKRGIGAFMHLGDAAHRGKNVEVQYHRDIFEKCFPHGKAKDGRTVEKLLVVGNHELFGFGHWHCSNADCVMVAMAGTDPARPLIFQRFMGSVPKFQVKRDDIHHPLICCGLFPADTPIPPSTDGGIML